MTDLVKRLRSEVGSFKDMIERRLEAADEIERLQKINLALRHPYDAQKAVIEDMRKHDPIMCSRINWLADIDAYAKDRGIE